MYKIIIYYLFAVMLTACETTKTNKIKSNIVDSVSVNLSQNHPMDSLEMLKEEDELLVKLLPDLCSRKFPTSAEMKMWELIMKKDADYKKLPVLARVLVRAYFGKQYWGEEGNPELNCESAALCPVYGDFLGTGDLDWYGLWPDSVHASTTSYYNGASHEAKEMLQGGVYTPWCSECGKTVGTLFTCVFNLNKRPINSICINNGFCHTEQQWKNHGRVAKMQLIINDQIYKTYDIKDTPKQQYLDIDSISPTMYGKKIIVSFKILGVYPGNKYDDVSISQLIFNSEYGADFDE